MGITQERINQNKNEFISLLKEIDRKGAKIESLIEKLESSDFFTAPGSAKYHCAFEGGCCEHSLNVYYNLMHLINYKGEYLFPTEELLLQAENSAKIIGLLHDVSKMNLYKPKCNNIKVYSPDGDKQDEIGKFYWKSEKGYELQKEPNRFVYGSHEMNSEYIIRHYIPLTIEESAAVLHHMGGMNWDSAKDNISEVYNKYPLAALLHTADLLSTYVDERI